MKRALFIALLLLAQTTVVLSQYLNNVSKTTDLYPLIVGHKFFYDGYYLDSGNNPVPDTKHLSVSELTGTAYVQGRNATVVVDSDYTPQGTLKSVTTGYVAKAANGVDLDVLLPLSSLTPGASDMWVTYIRPSSPVGVQYTILYVDSTGTFNIPDYGTVTGRAIVSLVGVNNGQETVTVPMGMYICQKFTTTLNATFTPTFPPLPVTIVKDRRDIWWLADEIGPVKLSSPQYQQIGSGGSLVWIRGQERQITATNFTTPTAVVANLKVFLQGPYSGGSMSTALNNQGLIPLTQPYSGAPWNYPGTERIASVPSGVVDWVLVELRTGTSASTKVAARAALLKSDGSVVGLDGTSPVGFSVASGSYYIVIHHRNHLAVMSANSVALSGSSSLYDFTTSQAQAYGGGMKDLGGGSYGMWAGDVTGDGQIKYIGSGNDRAPIFSLIGSLLGTVNGYYKEDVNMDGVVKYMGSGNDRAIIFSNIGTLLGVVTTQVP